MVAARDIKAGELILKESPLVVGPRINTSLLCLGCFRVLSKNYKLCQKCGLAPVCGANCELKSPHADYECEFYRRYSGENFKNDFVISNLQLVMPLKCLAFKTFPDYHDLWHNFVKLESHVEERKNDPIWKYYEKKVIEVREGFNSSHCSMKVFADQFLQL